MKSIKEPLSRLKFRIIPMLLSALLVTAIFPANFVSASGDALFLRTVRQTYSDYANDVKYTSDGGYVTVGITEGSNAASVDANIIKYDNAGTISWSRVIGGNGYEYAHEVEQTSDGGYIVTGATSSYSAGQMDIFLAKYTSTGTLSWMKTTGKTSNDYAHDIEITSDGGYIVTGFTNSAGAGQNDLILIKYTSAGAITWSKTSGRTRNDVGYAVKQTSDGGYIVGGTVTNGTTAIYDPLIQKYDSTGALQWEKTATSTSGGSIYDVEQTNDGGYVILGYSSSYGAGASDIILFKYNSSGTPQYYKVIGTTTNDLAYDLVEDVNDNFYITGRITTAGTNGDGVIIKTDSSGSVLWGTTIGDNVDYEELQAINFTSTGLVVAGLTYSFGAPSYSPDILLSSLDINGTIPGCEYCGTLSFSETYGLFTTGTPGTTVSNNAYTVTTRTPTTPTLSYINQIFCQDVGLISSDPEDFNFGDVTVSSSSSVEEFVISNSGTADLDIYTATLSGTDAAEFAIVSDTCSSTTVLPGNSCSVEVQFNPTGLGSKTADLVINSDSFNATNLYIGLSGVGI